MLWIGFALVTEGTSDDGFLSAVLRRSAQEVAGPGSEVAEPIVVRTSTGPGGREALVRAIRQADGMFNAIVYHRDGGVHPEREIERWVVPFRERLGAAGCPEPVVAVMPVRETEAWALADGDALRTVLGATWSDQRWGLPARRRDLEGEPDPKQLLRRVVERFTAWDPDVLTRLGACVSLECLRELSAFRRWENDLHEALKSVPGFTTR